MFGVEFFGDRGLLIHVERLRDDDDDDEDEDEDEDNLLLLFF